MGRAAICISPRLEHIQVSITADEVYAGALRIEEEVVGITTSIAGCNHAAVLH